MSLNISNDLLKGFVSLTLVLFFICVISVSVKYSFANSSLDQIEICDNATGCDCEDASGDGPVGT